MVNILQTAAETTTQDSMSLGPLDGQMVIALIVIMAIACVAIFGLLIYKKLNK